MTEECWTITNEIIGQIKETLIEMQHETLSGVFLGCPMCGEGVAKKVADVSSYWDKLITLVRSAE